MGESGVTFRGAHADHPGIASCSLLMDVAGNGHGCWSAVVPLASSLLMRAMIPPLYARTV